jgi:Tfp pilus assembly protein PilF
MLGGIQRRLGRRAAAQATLRRSLELSPTDEEAHFALGLALKTDEPLTAIEHFCRALELDPSLPYAHRELGAVLWQLGRLEEAQAALSRALSQDPSDAWAYEHLGLVFASLGDWPNAKHEFLEATSNAPDVGLFWRDLADACAMLGERQDAERYYLKALSLAVDDAYANAQYGVFLKAQGRFDKARTYLRRALDLDPNLKQAREVLGELGDHQ